MHKKIILLFTSLKNGGGRTFVISLISQITNSDIYLSSLIDTAETKKFANKLGVKTISIYSLGVLFDPNVIVVSNSQLTALISTLIFPFRHIYVTHGFANGLKFISPIRRLLWIIQINIPGTKLIGCGQAEFNNIKSLTSHFIKCYLVNNSIPPDLFSSNLKLKQYDKSNCCFQFCFIGRVSYQKGLDILFAALANSSIPHELTVIGDYQTKETNFCNNIKLKIAESQGKIKIVPAQKLTIDLLNQFDACIAPSRFEGLSYLVLELAYYGMPMIISDCPGNSDLIQNEEQGFIFRSGDAKSLNKALNRFSTTPKDEINKRITSLRRDIIKKYNPQYFGNSYKDIFNE